MLRTLSIIILVITLLLPTIGKAETPSKQEAKVAKRDSIYQGTTIKLDLGASAMTIGITKASIQHYEIAANCRLINRLYPTLELGYAGSTPSNASHPTLGTLTMGDSIAYRAQGGFMRIGCDLNPLKKHPQSPHAMLIGLRIGAAVQSVQQAAPALVYSAAKQISADCWGEIVAGCQVEVYNGLMMGWMGRFRLLFTRQAEGVTAEEFMPIYIPGFGNRDNTAWGVSYHIGYRF